ncbi:MAG: carboxypeptidase regulatory-like domain-containing protein [Candidatus Omnitrophica bacterium]|nr:carboxypeptidase regulatory-like domain-containing protein [Candidatus Omnitrophota bacterium]
MGNRGAIPKILLVTILCLGWVGCMNAPLPPENATLSAQFILSGNDDSEGIEVILPGTSYRGFTDREGRVRFDDLPAREYELLVNAEGYQTYRETSIVLEPGDHIFLGEIVLTPKKTDGEIYGTVRVEGEEQSEVEVLLLGSSQTVTSATDGRYHFSNVPVGNYQVSFYYPGAVAADPIDVTIEAGVQTALSEVVLEKSKESESQPTGAVKGKVSLEGDADFSGVTVFVSGAGKFAETDKEGLYWIEGIPGGSHDLIFEKEGYRQSEISGVSVSNASITAVTDVILLKKAPANTADATLRIEKNVAETPVDPNEPGIVAGYAFYPDRTDHSGIVVRVLNPPLETTTDETGAFLIEGVAPGLHTVRAEAEGYQNDALVDVEVDPGEVVRVPQLQLQYGLEPAAGYTTARIYGQVVDPQNQPIPGVSVAVERTAMSTITGRDGTFLIDQVPMGDYTMLFTVEGFEDSVASVSVASYDDIPVPVVTLQPVMEYLEVISSIPADGARKVEVSDHVHVELQFSEGLSKRGLPQHIQVYPPVATDIQLVQPDTLIIDLLRNRANGVTFNTEYTVALGPQLESTLGHRLEEPYELRFTTGGPRIIGSFPEDGDDGVLMIPGKPFVLQFNTAVNLRDLKKTTIRPDTGQLPNFVPRQSPYGYRVEMQMQFEPDRNYQVTVPRSVRTRDGDRFENTPYRIKFKTGSYDDLTDPALTEEFLGDFGESFDP